MFSLWDLNAYVEMTIQLQTHYSHFMVTVILTLYVCTLKLISLFNVVEIFSDWDVSEEL